jgi:YggT family protein
LLRSLIINLLNVYLLVIFGRIILSWFPISPESPLAAISRVFYMITEPVLGPVRNVLPSIGMFDLSPIVVIFGIRILAQIIQSA